MSFLIAFLVSIVLFALLSWILEHHWRSHAKHAKMLFIVRLFYYGGSLFFLLIMTASLFAL